MSPSQADLVYEAVKKDIITCQLAPGSLIAQPQLAERYEAGITPLREALQKLIKEGLVQSIPRSGYFISSITLLDVQELYELRSVVETAATRLAAARATPADLDRLHLLANYTYTYHNRESYTEFLQHNTEFHLAVAGASKNQRMLDAVSQLLDGMTRIFHLGLDLRDSAEEMREEHRELVAALQAHDPDQAEAIMRGQIEHSRQRVLEALISHAGSGLDSASIQVAGNRRE